MGTLEFLGDDEETISKSFKGATKDTLDNGGGSLFGMPFPLPLPVPALGPVQSQTIDSVDSLGIFASAYAKTIMAIDKALPPGRPLAPIFDPTFVLDIDPFIDFLLELGIINPYEWFMDNLPEMLELDIVGLAGCENNKEFAEALNKIDSSIDIKKAEEAASTICRFELPEFVLPEFPPSFSFDFSVDLFPIELFLMPNFDFPQVNWAIHFTLIELIGIVIELLSDIALLLAKIIEGILAFLKFIVEYIFIKIIEIIIIILAPLLAGILFVAELITYITKVVGAFIVAIVGHIIGDGVVTRIVAIELGLVQ